MTGMSSIDGTATRITGGPERTGTRHHAARGFLCRMVTLAVLVTAGAPAALGQDNPRATVDGGADTSGQNYTWTITNRADVPIDRVVVPHFMGDLCLPPEGWTCEITEWLGKSGKGGQVILQAKEPAVAVRPGRSVDVGLKIGPAGTPRGQGVIELWFSDGTSFGVLVEAPVKEAAASQNVALIGLSAIFAIFLLVRLRQGRRDAAATRKAAPPSLP